MASYYHFFEAITNTSGDSLPGYFGQVINRVSQAAVPIFSDENGTPIVAVSGRENMGLTSKQGNLSLYVEPGTYHLDIYAPDGVTFLLRVSDVAMNSTKGDKGDTGDTGQPGVPGGNVMSVGPFSGIPAIPDGITVGTDLVQTSGSTRGRLLASTTLTDADVAAYPLAITKTNNGRFFRRDPRELWLEDFGADPTGVQDSAPAFRAAMDYIIFSGRSESGAAFTRNGPTLRIGIGNFRLDSHVNWKVGNRIVGSSGSHEIGRFGTVFQVYGTGGIWFDRADTENGVTYSPAKTGANGFYLEHVSFEYKGPAVADGYSAPFGVKTSCQGVFHDVSFAGFPGVGLTIAASSGASVEAGNANGCVINGLTAVGNFVGVRVAGTDVSNLTVMGAMNFGQNRAIGFQLDCFLCGQLGLCHFKFNGNANTVFNAGTIYQGAWDATQAQLANTTPGTNAAIWVPWKTGVATDAGKGQWVSGGTYWPAASFTSTNANARNDLGFQYVEGGSVPPQIMRPSRLAGGQVPEVSQNSTARFDSSEMGEARTNNVYAVYSADQSRVAKLGAGFFQISSPGNAGGLFFRPNGTDFAWDYAGVGGFEPAFITGQGNTGPVGALRFDFRRGFGFGSKLWNTGTAAPTTGTAVVGAYQWNTTPPVGGVSAWTCTTAGTPGTWSPVGIVGAVRAAPVATGAAADLAALNTKVDAIITSLKNAGLMAP